MKIEVKRKVIEVLLCCGDPANGDGTPEATDALGYAESIAAAAARAWSPVEESPEYRDDWSQTGMSEAYTEAAYRLIETSPTLRREWFERPRGGK